jgi:hypothetical protein
MPIRRTSYLPSQVSWGTWSDIFTDLDLWRPVVKHICRTGGLSSAEKIETGFPGSCAVFLADAHVVVKLFSPFLYGDFLKEREIYQLIGERFDQMPGLLAEGILRDRIDWPYLVLVQNEGAWRVSALIDWADAEVGAREYEWVALWFGLCGRDPGMFREVLSAYDPQLLLDDRLRRSLIAYTFLHRFGLGSLLLFGAMTVTLP